MDSQVNEYIQLDRTFRELTLKEGTDNGLIVQRAWHHKELRWENLLTEYRVILLSEAGAGKTSEVRYIARTLRKLRKHAFFVRIEHVTEEFEDAFEEGSYDEFGAWASSGEEGWLLLDSVDEARLRDPKDFERAIRKLGRLLAPVLEQAHIVITGRTEAWRPTTDLLLCKAALPYTPAEKTVSQNNVSDTITKDVTLESNAKGNPAESFKIIALNDLNDRQIETFLKAKEVLDAKAFRDEVERKDALLLTTRPQDLAELIEYWKMRHKIGSRLELMRNSIDRRLEERNQDRSELHPISKDKLRKGARLVAAAVTLARQTKIRVPDGTDNAKGISIRDVLIDWDDVSCETLLTRPIFDEGIYGTVRFHHQSVREYLAAEWLHKLIVDDGSRSRVVGLFFRSQYGVDVVVPTMRPVLPWLAIFDGRIASRVCHMAPEILFEGGDPSQLPLETRRMILRHACEHRAQPAHARSIMEYAAVQRFASADLTDEIRGLLNQYADDDDIVYFLLRLVWQGGISGTVDETKRFAIESRAKHTRTAALRALATIGSAADQADVRRAFLGEDGELNRDWCSEMVRELPEDKESLEWLIAILRRVAPKRRFEHDSLSPALLRLVEDWKIPLLSHLVSGLDLLLGTPPIKDHHRSSISERYGWLLPIAGNAVRRLIEVQHPSAIKPSALSILHNTPIEESYGERELRDVSSSFDKLIPQWGKLNHTLFWYDVTKARADLEISKAERLTHFGSAKYYGSYWDFGPADFDLVCDDIGTRSFLDDKLVALTLAFAIYRQNERPPKWRRRLKRLVEGPTELKSMLHALLHPKTDSTRQLRRHEIAQRTWAAKRAEKEEADQQEWKKFLADNVDALRTPGRRNDILNAQYYLYTRMQSGEPSSGKWSDGNWRSLIPEYEVAIAHAFRDGAVCSWREHRPRLVSEGGDANRTPAETIIGSVGLSIETREDPGWIDRLSEAEAELATRYALCELNGFPSWFPSLYIAYPQMVIDAIIRGVDYELTNDNSPGGSHYVLYDVSWNGDWMWDALAPLIVSRLNQSVRSEANLRYMLNIVQGSSIDNKAVAQLAAHHAKASQGLSSEPMWYAVWVGVEPVVAIPMLESHLASLQEGDQKTQFAMRFITELIGGRGGRRSSTRQCFREVKYLKALYLLMHKYVREEDDIDRAGKGVYSPGLRDDAQDARHALFSFIYETPGKEAFLAMMDISRAHPVQAARPWIANSAREKATQDADGSAWAPHQVREFNDALERTPTNHRDLWYLAVDRLLDLKFELEEGDTSIASILQLTDRETEIRKYVGQWCRDLSHGRYVIPQEEELADAKKPDLRFHGVGFDGPVPVELKIADKWTGPHLFERLEMQLCGDYLRDKRSSRGIFLLVFCGIKSSWTSPNGGEVDTFTDLVDLLQDQWTILATQFPGVEDIEVIGIDLTKRSSNASSASRLMTKRKVATKKLKSGARKTAKKTGKKTGKKTATRRPSHSS